jgi:dTDP-4-amino-4,6-dideoxygalactose transaminase
MKPGDLPVCDDLYEQLISLPIHPGLSDADQRFVADTLRRSCAA